MSIEFRKHTDRRTSGGITKHDFTPWKVCLNIRRKTYAIVTRTVSIERVNLVFIIKFVSLSLRRRGLHGRIEKHRLGHGVDFDKKIPIEREEFLVYRFKKI